MLRSSFLLFRSFSFFLRHSENSAALSVLHHTGVSANEHDEAEPKTVSDLFRCYFIIPHAILLHRYDVDDDDERHRIDALHDTN